MEGESISIWCWLIPLFVGAICGYLGYLVGKGEQKRDNNAQLNALREENARLEAALATSRQKLSEQVEEDSHAASFDARAARAAFGKTIKRDDLKVVEGIGPKIEGLFHNYDVKTWKALSELSVAKCREVLDSAGDRYRIHDPASWPMQAKMCYQGRWSELYRWQEEHKRGKL